MSTEVKRCERCGREPLTMKWIVALCAITAFALVAMKGLDKYDERSCREHPAVVGSRTIENPAYIEDLSPAAMVPESAKKRFVEDPVYETWDGFLPW
jgi:hypothetical protein